MSMVDILDTSIALYRQNFALFAGVVAVLAVPETIISLAIRLSGPSSFLTTTGHSGNQNLHFHNGYFVGLAGSTILTLILSLLISGALAQVISDRYLGRRTSILQAYRSVGAAQFARLAAASILTTIVIVLPFVIATAIIIAVVIAGAPGVLVGLVAFILVVSAIVATVYAWVHLQFVAQTVVIERLRVISSLRRSWDLVRGSGWRVLGIVLVVILMVGILEAIIGGIIGVALFFVSPVAAGVVAGLIGILFQPFQFGAITLLYYDLRVRREGFDLEHLAGQIGGIQPAL